MTRPRPRPRTPALLSAAVAWTRASARCTYAEAVADLARRANALSVRNAALDAEVADLRARLAYRDGFDPVASQPNPVLDATALAALPRGSSVYDQRNRPWRLLPDVTPTTFQRADDGWVESARTLATNFEVTARPRRAP